MNCPWLESKHSSWALSSIRNLLSLPATFIGTEKVSQKKTKQKMNPGHVFASSLSFQIVKNALEVFFWIQQKSFLALLCCKILSNWSFALALWQPFFVTILQERKKGHLVFWTSCATKRQCSLYFCNHAGRVRSRQS